MVRRWCVGVLAALAVGACSVWGVAAFASPSPVQEPAGEFVHCDAGATCLAPAARVERP